MSVVKLSSKRQITLPANICRNLGIKEGDHLILEIKDGHATLIPVPKSYTDYFKGIAQGVYGKTAEEIDSYIKKERASWKSDD